MQNLNRNENIKGNILDKTQQLHWSKNDISRQKLGKAIVVNGVSFEAHKTSFTVFQIHKKTVNLRQITLNSATPIETTSFEIFKSSLWTTATPTATWEEI